MTKADPLADILFPVQICNRTKLQVSQAVMLEGENVYIVHRGPVKVTGFTNESLALAEWEKLKETLETYEGSEPPGQKEISF